MRPFKSSPASKYGAKRTAGYASKREADYASLLRSSVEVLTWLEQVPIKLTGGVKYVADFLVFMRDGSWKLVEVKGMETPAWKLKMRLLEAERPELWAKLEVVR